MIFPIQFGFLVSLSPSFVSFSPFQFPCCHHRRSFPHSFKHSHRVLSSLSPCHTPALNSNHQLDAFLSRKKLSCQGIRKETQWLQSKSGPKEKSTDPLMPGFEILVHRRKWTERGRPVKSDTLVL